MIQIEAEIRQAVLETMKNGLILTKWISKRFVSIGLRSEMLKFMAEGQRDNGSLNSKRWLLGLLVDSAAR